MHLLQLHQLLALLLPLASTYTIENCGTTKPSIEFAITLAQTAMMLDFTDPFFFVQADREHRDIVSVLPCSPRKDNADLEKYNSLPLLDIQRSVLSNHGYTAMYKSSVFKPFLQNLMSNILHIPSVEAAGRDQTPSFVCVKQNMPQTTYETVGFDPLERCVASGVTSFWVKDTVFVFLCPSFTDLTPQPVLTPGGPKDVYCPVVRNNVFLGQSDPLVRYQNYDLVHQLAHLYLQKGGLTGETVPKEVMDWNSCVGLGWAPFQGGPSVKNPFNLVYYTAFVNQECVQMPDPFLPPFSGQTGHSGLLSVGNLTGGSSQNFTDLRLQS